MCYTVSSFFYAWKGTLDGQIFLKMFGKLFQSKKPEKPPLFLKEVLQGLLGWWLEFLRYIHANKAGTQTDNKLEEEGHPQPTQSQGSLIYGFNCLKNCMPSPDFYQLLAQCQAMTFGIYWLYRILAAWLSYLKTLCLLLCEMGWLGLS